MARQLNGYGKIAIPHCGFETTDNEKGYITFMADYNSIYLNLQKAESKKVFDYK